MNIATKGKASTPKGALAAKGLAKLNAKMGGEMLAAGQTIAASAGAKKKKKAPRKKLKLADVAVKGSTHKMPGGAKPKTFSKRGPTVAMLRKEAKAYNKEVMIGGHVKGGISKMKKDALIKALQEA